MFYVYTPDTKKAKLVKEEITETAEKVHKERSSKRRKKGKTPGKSPGAQVSKELIRPKRLTLLQKVLHFNNNIFLNKFLNVFPLVIARRNSARTKYYYAVRALYCPAELFWLRKSANKGHNGCVRVPHK